MNEKIGMYTKDEILEYMTDCEGAFLGRSMYDAIFEKIDGLQQQLKDKDEKISNLIKLLIEMVFDDINDLGVYQELVARHLVKLGYIVKEDGLYKELETNKED